MLKVIQPETGCYEPLSAVFPIWETGLGISKEADLIQTYILKGSIHEPAPLHLLAPVHPQAPWLPTYLLVSYSFCQAGTSHLCIHATIRKLPPKYVCALLQMCTFTHMQIFLCVWGAKNRRPHPRQAPARSLPEQPVAGPASLDSTRDQRLPAPLRHRLGFLQRVWWTPPTPQP